MSFDTWQDTGYPSNNFVGIATTSSPMQSVDYVATNTAIPALRNVLHHVVVTTTSSGITVWMDGTQVLSYTTSLPPDVLVGFTGATGGFNDLHQVENVLMTSGPPPAPAVTGISPTSGPTAGGATVTITGTSFVGVTGVQFGSTAATYTVNSPTQITATSPAGTGTADVTVTTPGGTSARAPPTSTPTRPGHPRRRRSPG